MFASKDLCIECGSTMVRGTGRPTPAPWCPNKQCSRYGLLSIWKGYERYE